MYRLSWVKKNLADGISGFCPKTLGKGVLDPQESISSKIRLRTDGRTDGQTDGHTAQLKTIQASLRYRYAACKNRPWPLIFLYSWSYSTLAAGSRDHFFAQCELSVTCLSCQWAHKWSLHRIMPSELHSSGHSPISISNL